MNIAFSGLPFLFAKEELETDFEVNFSYYGYRKIPKISPGVYIFQRPFQRGLFLEGLIFGVVYLRREICVSKSIGLALQLKVILPFLLCFILYLRAIFQVQAPWSLYLEGRFNGGFFALPVWGAYIWRGLYMEGLIIGILRYFGLSRTWTQGIWVINIT